MENRRIRELLEKHIASECDQSEQEELAMLIEGMGDSELKSELFKIFEQYQPSVYISQNEKRNRLSAILNADRPKASAQKKTVKYYRAAIAVAASVLIVFSLSLYIYKSVYLSYNLNIKFRSPAISSNQATSYIRNLTLPDGTSVILKAGSTIRVPEKFEGSTREVILEGEAYFDVKHINNQPFVIHTGNVKTTVLGTAFNIKAWPSDKKVTVSVTRGKVKVENEQKVLALLTKDQEAFYDQAQSESKTKTVEAEKIVTDWTKEDMEFDHVPLGSIVQVLGSRYGVNITITNPQLAKAEIVSAFSGTESLQDVMEVICAINPNTHFNIKGKEIIISNN